MKAFISYAHEDEAAKNRLKAHLSVLREEGAIDDWHDREILPGQRIDNAISEQLESCDLFLALVSPDFFYSDYCRNREMARALERYEAGEVMVVAIIVEPCDWHHSPLSELMALPRDGQAVSLWDNENAAYAEITSGIRRLLESRNMQQDPVSIPEVPPNTESPRFRVQRDFDEIDRSDFRNQSFGAIKDFFESSATQLDAIDGFRCRFRDLGPTSFTCTLLNRHKDRGESHITVHSGGHSLGFGDISYSNSADAAANTSNGWLTVESDGYELRLKLNRFSFGNEDQFVSVQSAAEILWKEFSNRAGIEYD